MDYTTHNKCYTHPKEAQVALIQSFVHLFFQSVRKYLQSIIYQVLGWVMGKKTPLYLIFT